MVGFLRSGLILAVLKAVGNRPESTEVLIRVVRKGRMSPELSWRREDAIWSMGHMVGWLDDNVLHLLCKVGGKVIS